MTFKAPETHEEIVENRRKALDALINEDPKAQCMGDLCAAEFDLKTGEPTGKEQRCAVGAIAKELLGINTVAEFEDYCDVQHHDVYGEVAQMLGLDDECTHIWRLNDDGEKFAKIATVLAAEWDLDSK